MKIRLKGKNGLGIGSEVQSTVMFISGTATVIIMTIRELRELNKNAAKLQEKSAREGAAFPVLRFENMVCDLNADIYGKGFFGIKRKLNPNYILSFIKTNIKNVII